MDISRRSFLKSAAAAGVALPLAARGAAAVEPARVGPITVFSKHLQWLDYGALADTVAEAGFDGIDLTVRPGGHVLPERVAEDLPRAVQAARRAGLVVPLMTTAITDPREPHTERILRTASAQGIGFYRMGWLGYGDQPPAEALERHRATLRALAELNRAHRIHGAYQNHAGTNVGGPVWDLWPLVRDLDPRWMGIQYDVRHATVEGGTSWPLGLRLLHSHIRTTDIKDFRWERDERGWSPRTVPLGEGMVDFGRYFQLVKQLGVGGPISMHFEYAPLEGRNDLPARERRRQAVELMSRDLRALRGMLSAAGLSADG